jgi:cell division protein FtsZ
VLLSIQGGSNLGIFEINDAARLVQEAVHPEANIIFGAVIDDTLGDEVRVTVIAAGFDGGEPTQKPKDSRRTNFVPSETAVATPGPTGTGPVESDWNKEPALVPIAPIDRSFDDADDDDLDIPDFLK